MKLEGKTSLITGGGSGIGLAIARRFADEGARVAIAGRDEVKLRAALESIRGPRAAEAFPADVADRRRAQELAASVESRFGRIDILVNNAGINIPRRTLADILPEDWDQLLAVNATGVFNLTHAVLPAMRARRDGLIITISSISGLRPSALGGAAYCAAKHAATALARVIGLEERGRGIRSSVISPGEVDTPILEHRPEKISDEHRAVILRPEDVAEAALFIASLPPRACVPELVIKPVTQAFA